MADYIAVFTPGLEALAQNLPKILKGGVPVRIESGFILFTYGGDPRTAANTPFFSNCFYVVRRVRSPRGFGDMVSAAASNKNAYLKARGTFRVRFSRENQFEKAPPELVSAAENEIRRATRMNTDRANPGNEFWYIIRNSGDGYYCQLIKKALETPEKGELRPETAWGMCYLAGIRSHDSVCDPFAGYGAIPRQAARFSRNVTAMDKDAAMVSRMKKRFEGANSAVNVISGDIFDKSAGVRADVIVTDPPWGEFTDIANKKEYCENMLAAFERVLTPGGRAVILTALKDETIAASKKRSWQSKGRSDVLINGRKAAILILSAPDEQKKKGAASPS